DSLLLITISFLFSSFFFFMTAPPTHIYTLSLHDALPISSRSCFLCFGGRFRISGMTRVTAGAIPEFRAARRASVPFSKIFFRFRSEEHTSELQSLRHLVCRLLLEKKKKKKEFIYLHIIY